MLGVKDYSFSSNVPGVFERSKKTTYQHLSPKFLTFCALGQQRALTLMTHAIHLAPSIFDILQHLANSKEFSESPNYVAGILLVL